MCRYVRMNFNIIEVINSIISSYSLFPAVFSRNFVWVARNLTLDPEDLNLKEVQGIVNIFFEFIEPFLKSEYIGDSPIVDIVQGLAALANINKAQYKRVVAGLYYKEKSKFVIVKNMGLFLSS